MFVETDRHSACLRAIQTNLLVCPNVFTITHVPTCSNVPTCSYVSCLSDAFLRQYCTLAITRAHRQYVTVCNSDWSYSEARVVWAASIGCWTERKASPVSGIRDPRTCTPPLAEVVGRGRWHCNGCGVGAADGLRSLGTHPKVAGEAVWHVFIQQVQDRGWMLPVHADTVVFSKKGWRVGVYIAKDKAARRKRSHGDRLRSDVGAGLG